MPEWRASIRARLARGQLAPPDEGDIVEELALHLEAQYEELRARGCAHEQAVATLDAQLDEADLPAIARIRTAARRRSAPDIPGLAADHRRLLPSVWQDLRHACRSLRRAPAFGAVIVLSLGLVIGSNAALFGVLHAGFLRTLEVHDPEELVLLLPMNQGRSTTLLHSHYEVLRRAPGLPPIEAYRFEPAEVRRGTRSENLWIDAVSGGFLELLGVPPMLGRAITPRDEELRAPVAVVSAEFWRTRLGADSAVIGTAVMLGDLPFTVVGVMPPRFTGIHFARRFNILIPLTAPSPSGFEDFRRLGVSLLARVEGGANDGPAREALAVAYERCCPRAPQGDAVAATPRGASLALPQEPPPIGERQYRGRSPDERPHLAMVDASRGLVWNIDYRGDFGRVLGALMIGVLILLLIACANVATLLLARATARQREFAVRLALGASRRRLVRQLMTESFVLAGLGAAFGLLVARAGTSLFIALLPATASPLDHVLAWRASPGMFAFTTVVTVACTLLFGALPARRASRTDLRTPLHGVARAVAGVRGWAAERVLVVAQITLALLLVSTAMLFLATLRSLTRFDGGYGDGRVLLARMRIGGAGSGSGRMPASHQVLLDRISALPGVAGASLAGSAPLFPDAMHVRPFRVPGQDQRDGGGPGAVFNPVTPGFFAATGITVRRGRDFTTADAAGSEPVVIVSELFARRYFGDRDPVGAPIMIGRSGQELSARVIGVVEDAPDEDPRSPPRETWYRPIAQVAETGRLPEVTLIVQTTGHPLAVAPSLQRLLAEAAPTTELRRLTGFHQLLSDVLARERLAALLATLFAALAVVLSAVGLYGLLAYTVTRRTHEIGIRAALGARRSDTIWLVGRQTTRLLATGVALGVPLALAAGRAIGAQLHGVAPADPLVMAGAVLLLAVVAAIASLAPARRATAVDPLTAIKTE